MFKAAATILTPYLGILAAAAGAALLVADVAVARAAGAPVANLAADITLFAAGVLAYRLARAGRKEAPALALVLLVVGSAPALLAAGRWWMGGLAGAVIAAAAPHAMPQPRARVWIGAAALLALAAIPAGVPVALSAAGFVALIGAASSGLARELDEWRTRARRVAANQLEDGHRRMAEVVQKLQAYEGPNPGQRRSYLRLALSRRLGMMTALATSVERELRDALDPAHAGNPEAIAAAAQRGIERAARITELASGAGQGTSGTALKTLWPRVRGYLGAHLLPSHHVESTIAADLPSITGTAEEWIQILSLLAEEGLAAMPGGGILRFTALRAERPGFATLTLTDTRTDTTAAPAGAVAENLELAEALIAALGGTMRRVPSPDLGIEVTIETPMHLPVATTQPAAEGARFSGDLLVADDDPGALKGTASLLKSLGFEIMEADNGTVALARFRSDPAKFRAAVLDVVMPGTPVGDVVAAMREVRSDLPVLLISGYQVDRYVDSILALGQVRFLRKPATREDLHATLHDLLLMTSSTANGG